MAPTAYNLEKLHELHKFFKLFIRVESLIGRGV
jgi:hypothetical protein